MRKATQSQAGKTAKVMDSRSAKAPPPPAAEDLNRLYEAFAASAPLWTEADARELAQAWSTGPEGPFLRASLAMGCQSGASLIKMAEQSKESAAALACSAICARHAASRLRDFATLLEPIAARARMALCSREDMNEVLAEAERGAFEPKP